VFACSLRIGSTVMTDGGYDNERGVIPHGIAGSGRPIIICDVETIFLPLAMAHFENMGRDGQHFSFGAINERSGIYFKLDLLFMV